MTEKVGVSVICTVCGLRKKPVGRSAPLEMANSLCDDECYGYRLDPKPGQLWPGETQEEFGY
jgi:hypothetical protein